MTIAINHKRGILRRYKGVVVRDLKNGQVEVKSKGYCGSVQAPDHNNRKRGTRGWVQFVSGGSWALWYFVPYKKGSNQI